MCYKVLTSAAEIWYRIVLEGERYQSYIEDRYVGEKFALRLQDGARARHDRDALCEFGFWWASLLALSWRAKWRRGTGG